MAQRPDNGTILIAGGGIAGLSAALAFSAKGIPSRVLERAKQMAEFGAGLQISPNASRILRDLNVLDELAAIAFKPEAVHIVDAVSGRQIAAVPLGDAAEARWGAPYLVAHRSDLHSALLATAKTRANIDIAAGSTVVDGQASDNGVNAEVESDSGPSSQAGRLLVAADGVWSSLRAGIRSQPQSRFTGHVAWRALLDPEDAKPLFADDEGFRCVIVFVNPAFHLIAYPITSGRQINLVAVVPGAGLAERWAIEADVSQLHQALDDSKLAFLSRLPIDWTAWPLHEVDPKGRWSAGSRTVLIGDAAHAMTPFLAQGAAMAIEDGYMLANCVAGAQDGLDNALITFERARKLRVSRVVKRGAFTRFAWHASGPVALVRNILLAARSGPGLMREFDWLYGFDADR